MLIQFHTLQRVILLENKLFILSINKQPINTNASLSGLAFAF